MLSAVVFLFKRLRTDAALKRLDVTTTADAVNGSHVQVHAARLHELLRADATRIRLEFADAVNRA